jgi:hypothetical protein
MGESQEESAVGRGEVLLIMWYVVWGMLYVVSDFNSTFYLIITTYYILHTTLT